MSRARTFADLATASEENSLSNRNMIINGNMAIHQRQPTDTHSDSAVDRYTLVKNQLDIIFANEQEILSLIDGKSFSEAISFAKEIKKNMIITRGEKGAISIKSNEIIECNSKSNLKIKDLTGAGDLFAAGYLHGLINNLSVKESLMKGTELSSKIIQKIGARI